jgi:hypothetical protein
LEYNVLKIMGNVIMAWLSDVIQLGARAFIMLGITASQHASMIVLMIRPVRLLRIVMAFAYSTYTVLTHKTQLMCQWKITLLVLSSQGHASSCWEYLDVA